MYHFSNHALWSSVGSFEHQETSQCSFHIVQDESCYVYFGSLCMLVIMSLCFQCIKRPPNTIFKMKFYNLLYHSFPMQVYIFISKYNKLAKCCMSLATNIVPITRQFFWRQHKSIRHGFSIHIDIL